MHGVDKGDILSQLTFIAGLFGVASKLNVKHLFMSIAFPKDFLQPNQNICDLANYFLT